MIRWVIRTVCVWYLHFPHLALLRAMGPRIAVLGARVLAWLHWFSTFAGAERAARQALTKTLPQCPDDAGVRTLLRRNLLLKHQNFVEWHCYSTRRGQRFIHHSYRIQGLEQLEKSAAEGRGGIVLVFHFGLAQTAFAALKGMGFDFHLHKFRGETYGNEAFSWMSKAAMRASVRSDKASGIPVIYHRPNFTFAALARHLSRGGLLGMNGDGMMSDDFVDVPFLGGTMRFPTGPARLAACTGAPLMPAFALPEGVWGHHMIVHQPIRCQDDSEESVSATVAEYAGLLDNYVRRYPWAWWLWHRLEIEQREKGQVHFAVRGQTIEGNNYHYEPLSHRVVDHAEVSTTS